MIQLDCFQLGWKAGNFVDSADQYIFQVCHVSPSTGIIKFPIGGNQTMQMYGNFEGFPLNSALFGLVI